MDTIYMTYLQFYFIYSSWEEKGKTWRPTQTNSTKSGFIKGVLIFVNFGIILRTMKCVFSIFNFLLKNNLHNNAQTFSLQSSINNQQNYTYYYRTMIYLNFNKISINLMYHE